ncbi:MAG: ABC-type transport system involved in multi-copper enzyme maturation, permease component, partial [Verrucomicrobiales bacterium]|nr:ABC-type transport system involved in multi-copper enzyme maturation, permease component [Verrucomicrobiales bacterium]
TPDYEQDAEKLVQSRIKENPEAGKDLAALRKMARERVKAAYQIVPPDYRREWKVDMGWRKKYLDDKPLFLRIKFNVAEYAEGKTFLGLWEIGEPGSNNVYREQMSLAADAFHEFKIPPHLIGPDGILRINFINRNQTGLLFQFEDGLEVLYPEGSFGLNFSRGVAIIFCWLALLAALGLTCASFLSFPVAAFSSLGILLLALSTGTLKQIVDENGIMEVNHETGIIDHPSVIDAIAVPVSKGLLKLLNLVRDFSPIDALSSGRSISWPLLGFAFAQIVVLMCGIFALIGIFIFNRRELATAQSSH